MSTYPEAAAHGNNMTGLLNPALERQHTGFPDQRLQQTSVNSGLPLPLKPQKTGPPPPVRFGISPDLNKLMPQQTGRRANLSQASKCHALPDKRFLLILWYSSR